MRNTGDYPHRCRLMNRTLTEDKYGQEVETYVPGSYLWARVEEEIGRFQDDKGALQTGITGTLFIRNYPQVPALAMIQDHVDRLWHIDSIRRGDNELIADVYTNDVNVGGIW